MDINRSTLNNATRSVPQQRRINFRSTFNTISAKTLEDLVKNSSTCCLDTLQTSFFKNVYSCLEIDVL